jgi:2-succinyl-6-hydroxy-2,4-cyclohexadiene-1-carboxylate synthase
LKPRVLVLMHGFLGSSTDWNFLTEGPSFKNWIVIKPDLFSAHSDKNLFKPLSQWGNCFWIFILEKLQEITKKKDSALENFDFYLCGYSLGGRLLLHAFHEKPKVVQKAVFISASYGFFNDTNFNSEKRKLRRQQDAIWASDFNSCKSEVGFDDLICKWNNQDVFVNKNQSSTTSFKKSFTQYNMDRLAFALTEWGQAEQKFYLNETIDWIKTYWIYGSNDHKYEKLYSDLISKVPTENIFAIEKAAHRVSFDNPVLTAQTLEKILLK